MSEGMTVGSLFAGIGGFDLAAERVWGPACVKWQVEIDDWCRRVLAKHWPEVTRYSDIREVTGDELEPVDLICGGFPCQDVSSCNQAGQGIAGARSGLWSDYARILRLLRPRFALVENVPNLRNRGLERVLEDLATCGYDAEWDCLPASAFGAYHERDRLWLVAYRQGTAQQYGRVLEEGGEWRAPLQSRRLHGMALAACGRETGARLEGEPRLDRMVSGLSGRVDRLRGLGNAIAPQVAEFLFRRIQELEASQ